MQTPPVLEAFVKACLAALDSDSPRDTILRETHELFADPQALAAQIPPFTENEVPTSEYGWRLGGEHVLHNDDNLTVIVLDTLPGIAQPPHDHDMSAISAPASHPAPLPDCDAPYFNDVWRSVDGATWELVSPSAGWSERPGHQCEVLRRDFVCFGGFGLIENPMDVWSSSDGREWKLLADPPWNAQDQTQVKYDFDSITVNNNGSPMIMTFGGDRETFDFADPENYLRIDNDVWIFGPAQ